MYIRKHAISIYGTTTYKKAKTHTYKQRYWKKRADGIKQRYRKKVTRTQRYQVKGGKRITIYGTAKEVAEAKKMIHQQQLIPKKEYEDKVSAEIFLKTPEKYTHKGKWERFTEEETP